MINEAKEVRVREIRGIILLQNCMGTQSLRTLLELTDRVCTLCNVSLGYR